MILEMYRNKTGMKKCMKTYLLQKKLWLRKTRILLYICCTVVFKVFYAITFLQ